MSRKLFLTAFLGLPVLVASLVYGQTLVRHAAGKSQAAQAEGYVCPLTGEELPCPNCCPLNRQQ
jgi:hypothetical protein